MAHEKLFDLTEGLSWNTWEVLSEAEETRGQKYIAYWFDCECNLQFGHIKRSYMFAHCENVDVQTCLEETLNASLKYSPKSNF